MTFFLGKYYSMVGYNNVTFTECHTGFDLLFCDIFLPFHYWYTSRCRNGICSISLVSIQFFIDLKLLSAVIRHWGKIVLDWHIVIYCLFESQDEKALIDWTDRRKWRWMPMIISRQSLTPLSKSNNTFRNVWRTLQENRTVILLLGLESCRLEFICHFLRS